MSDIEKIFTPLITYVQEILTKEKVKSSRYSEIPFYLGATAGMRLLTTEKRQDILKLIREYIHSTPFAFRDEFAKILSGEEEGLFGWIAVNYLTDRLWAREKDSSKRLESVGALDLGGASTQIVFEPTVDIMANYVEYSNPVVNQTHLIPERYQLYGTSFLGNGLNEFLDTYRSALAHGKKDGTKIPDPCLNSDATEEYIDADNRSYTFIGTSDPITCREEISKLIDTITYCEVEPCSIRGRYQPIVDKNMQLIAFSGFTSVLHTAGTPETVNTLALLHTYAGEEICSIDWEKLKEKLPKSNEKYLKRTCASLVYIVALLRDSYNISDDIPNAVLFKDVINDLEVSWALGRMIYEVNLLGYRHVVTTLRFWIAIGILVLTTVAFALLWFATKKKVDRLQYELPLGFDDGNSTKINSEIYHTM